MKRTITLLAAVAAMASGPSTVSAKDTSHIENVVLVHGAAVDGSSWRKVYDILVRKHYTVSVVQLPLSGLDADIAATRAVIARQNGPVVLVGHSYGGAVITVAGDDPKVKSLVYVAATQPDAGESVGDLNARWPRPSHVLMVDETSLIVDPAMFKHDVADDLSADEARYLAASQRPTAVSGFSAKLPTAAWHAKPSFGIVARNDRTLSPEMLRTLYRRSHTVAVEFPGSHLIQISKPREVADVVVKASKVDF
ncbi:alpha/beta fold hydrolase [Novosphingobium panipatense]|uniref:Pimeloyl-ACP methyl ester carboxylesterase n=1 Tax=Novosphingobium panipatense TaxID=428991 RepID=A0ABY1QY73_9SPHN|nr:alpha/beta hydrolase [Novosphingobium panipatense]SMP81128.1 Pimeloyl-ACP methyl ester carboxylesterase [Novosphingobium panipatense]